jgi:hypothetical protein
MTAGVATNNSVTVTVKSLYGFAGTVSLSCTVAPLAPGTAVSPPACGFATNPLPVKGSDLSTQLIVATAAATAANRKLTGMEASVRPALGSGWRSPAPIAGRFRYRWLASAMIILALGGSMLSLTCCAGSVSSSAVRLPRPLLRHTDGTLLSYNSGNERCKCAGASTFYCAAHRGLMIRLP